MSCIPGCLYTHCRTVQESMVMLLISVCHLACLCRVFSACPGQVVGPKLLERALQVPAATGTGHGMQTAGCLVLRASCAS